MYNVVREFNSETLLAEREGRFFVLKKINLDELGLVKALIGINCINVIKFYETVTLDGAFFAVEEYVNGVTLEEYISKKGALPDEEVRSIALGICNGLRAVHSIGIVHRDINPNNVMLDSNGIVKIIDFGISRTYKAETHKDTHILGTQGYAAPEQYGFAQTGATADIYSLGVLINYMKTLALPGEALTQGTFRPIVEKCTKIDETLRYSSVEELSAAIEGRHIPEKSRAPGFRSNVWWHKLIASVYYLLIAFFYIAYLAPTEDVDYSENIFFLFFITFVLVAPIPIIFNTGDWVGRLKFASRYSEKRRKLIPLITGIIYAAAAFLLFIILY